MKILLVSATGIEIAPTEKFLNDHFKQQAPFHYKGKGIDLFLLITGIGLTQTAYSLAKICAVHQFDLAINAGIAGAFDTKLNLGDVVQVVSEGFGDVGAEDSNGNFMDAFEMGLIDKHQPPFLNGELINEASASFNFLPKAKGISVNKVHGSDLSIQKIKEKYDADIESMEGAAFFYACLLEGLPFLEIRAISNYVEARNKENWDIPLAIEKLNEVVIEMIKTLATDFAD